MREVLKEHYKKLPISEEAAQAVLAVFGEPPVAQGTAAAAAPVESREEVMRSACWDVD
jgi:hypothetical protein